MTITYYDNQLRFGPTPIADLPIQNSNAEPINWIICDDSDLDKCFSLLCNGNDVYVTNRHGIRNFFLYLMHNFKYVKAAGGRVVTPQGSCLLIHREGKWDLPKGMVETGETLAAAALREVKEETGLAHATIEKLLTKSYHIYDKYGGWHLKQTSWYAMRTDLEYMLTPQTEEGIRTAQWVEGERANLLIQNSFASLRQLTQILTQTSNH